LKFNQKLIIICGLFLLLIVGFFSVDNFYGPVQNSFPTGMAGAGICGADAWEYCSAAFGSCEQDDAAYIGGGTCGANELCCRIKPYCGDGILDTPEECDGSLFLATCQDAGYYAGTSTCTAVCNENFTACHNCGNGTCDAGETCSGCVADCNGTQADCSAGQVCELGECVAEAPSVCEDSTSLSTCSNSTGAPWYCDANATLVQNCSLCSCEDGYACNDVTGGCFYNRGTSYSGVTFKVDDAIIELNGEAIGDGGSGSLVGWEGIRRRDKIEFSVQDGKSNGAEKHTMEVTSISRARKRVEITIRSDPIEVVLYEDEPQRIDLDGDSIEDIIMLATNIGLSDFDIDIQGIDEEKLEQENGEEIVIIKERKVFFSQPLMSPVFDESPDANMYEFIIVNAVIMMSMIFFFFRFAKEIRRV
jgi:hypothetical protein